MLNYEPKSIAETERPWHLLLSLALGSAACAFGLALWARALPSLWWHATGTVLSVSFLPTELMVGAASVGLMVGGCLAALAYVLSQRRIARVVALAGLVSALLPTTNLVLLMVITFARKAPHG
jgi:hypothetical protein